jgi:hypothetical protein
MPPSKKKEEATKQKLNDLVEVVKINSKNKNLAQSPKFIK